MVTVSISSILMNMLLRALPQYGAILLILIIKFQQYYVYFVFIFYIFYILFFIYFFRCSEIINPTFSVRVIYCGVFSIAISLEVDPVESLRLPL